MNNNAYDNNQAQFVLSYELLLLLEWMVEHDAPKLKKMIAKALKSGLKQEMENSVHLQHERQLAQEAQYSVVEFFGLLEALVAESLSEQAVQATLEKNLMPAIEQIDSSVDNDTIRLSVEKATHHIDQRPCADPQKALFRELLKRWKPNKKSSAH